MKQVKQATVAQSKKSKQQPLCWNRNWCPNGGQVDPNTAEPIKSFVTSNLMKDVCRTVLLPHLNNQFPWHVLNKTVAKNTAIADIPTIVTDPIFPLAWTGRGLLILDSIY